MAVRNLVNLEGVEKSFGRRPLLDGVSLGIAAGERIGVVGRNGGGKSTLLKVIAQLEPVDAGRVTQNRDLRLGSLAQAAEFDPDVTIRQCILGDSEPHEWASDATTRDVLTALLGGYEDDILDRELGPLSGGERRRVELAQLLTQELDLLILDEPTNHLDVEAVAWLASHLRSTSNVALVVVTHDRWFLDEVSDRTWEVVNGQVEEYDGGYSAFVLAKAERLRQASSEESRRNNLVRKELAWLRRGAPARTTKPKFRIDAANELISTEPPPRNEVELLAFAGARLGKTVFETHDVSLRFDNHELIDDVSWNVGPGDRIGVIGVNGAGKTSLMRLLVGELQPSSGRVVTGTTVKLAYLSQHLEHLNPKWRVLEAVEQVAQRVEIGKGKELTASQLCERLGFGSDAQWTPVADLSGGERRRLQLTRLLMDGPNVLILDEPTNDFDVETLTALEDLLDSFAGTILVISHDRYFLERVCNTFVGMLGDGNVRDLPRGVDEYLLLRAAGSASVKGSGGVRAVAAATLPLDGLAISPVDRRAMQKNLARVERTVAKLDREQSTLHGQLTESASDHVRTVELSRELDELQVRKSEAEELWMSLAEQLAD